MAPGQIVSMHISKVLRSPGCTKVTVSLNSKVWPPGKFTIMNLQTLCCQVLDKGHGFVYTINMRKKKIERKPYPKCPTCKIETDPKGVWYCMPYQYTKYVCSKCGHRIDKKIGKLVRPY